MYVLGIESSCDETSVSVVKDGKTILSNIVSSSLQLHKKYGGVVPEIASRMQLETISKVADCAIRQAGIKLEALNLVSVTNGPGLSGSLLVGISFAKSVSLCLGIPLLGINHLESHIYANFLNQRDIKLPCVALVVSGGHTSLFYLQGFTKIETLGQTLDDAAGEAFDKVAKLLGMGYPGGPLIEKLARLGDSKKIKFKCSGTRGAFDFSFSGIKTAVLYYAQRNMQNAKHAQAYADIAASFQETVIDTLIDKTISAAWSKKVRSILVGGGVAVNSRLREKFFQASKAKGLNCFFPPKELCLDNAAMVAGLGYQLFRQGRISSLGLSLELN